MSDYFQKESTFLGITASPAFGREPEGNGVAERFLTIPPQDRSMQLPSTRCLFCGRRFVVGGGSVGAKFGVVAGGVIGTQFGGALGTVHGLVEQKTGSEEDMLFLRSSELLSPADVAEGERRVEECKRGLVKKCVNEIRGDSLRASVHSTHSVDVHDPARDIGQQLRRVEPPERLLRDEQPLPDDGRRVLHLT
jgi:hypothetical protein